MPVLLHTLLHQAASLWRPPRTHPPGLMLAKQSGGDDAPYLHDSLNVREMGPVPEAYTREL